MAKGKLGVHARGAVDAEGLVVDLADALRERGVVDGAGVRRAAPPRVVALGVTPRRGTAGRRVEELPEPDAEQILRALELWRDDPVSRALAAAPFDDEPETNGRRRGGSRRSQARGRGERRGGLGRALRAAMTVLFARQAQRDIGRLDPLVRRRVREALSVARHDRPR